MTTDFVHQSGWPGDFPAIGTFPSFNPTEAMTKLVPWKAQFWPDRAVLSADLDLNGSYEFTNSWTGMSIPWNEVNIQLLGVASNAANTPFVCNQGATRNMVWRQVQVYPVKHIATAAFPKETGTINTPLTSDFRAFDLRDNQFVGAAPRSDAPAQPNSSNIDGAGPVLFCSIYCYNGKYSGVTTRNITFVAPDLSNAQSLSLTYDVWRIFDEGTVQISLNGTLIGTLPQAASLPGARTDGAGNPNSGAIVHRSIAVPASALNSQAINTLTLSFVGRVKLDRLQFEMSASSPIIDPPPPPTTTTTSSTTTSSSTTSSTTTSSTTTTSTTTTIPRKAFVDPCPKGDPTVFCEDFTWQGNHAATINGGLGSTTWWNPDAWDTRGDTTNFGALGTVNQFHVDVHKAAGGNDLTNGTEDNTQFSPGGAAGVPGLGVMRLEHQGIATARLRNPGLIDSTTPLTVEFFASRFVTGGHWWELAITPADITTGGENTAVPSGGNMMTSWMKSGNPITASGTTSPSADGINLIPRGITDDCTTQPWQVGFHARQTVGGVTTDFVNQVDRVEDVQTLGSYPSYDTKAAMEELVPWRARFWPDHVELASDNDFNGSYETVNAWKGMTIPWNEVHVHLLGVAYNAAGHPLPGACNQGTSREMVWRQVKVFPVKGDTTFSFPREIGTTNTPRLSDFMNFDIRDNQRLNPAPRTDAPSQPNDSRSDGSGPALFCSFYCYNAKYSNVTTRNLNFNAPSLDNVKAMRLNYDVWRIYDEGDIQLSVNGTLIGNLPKAATMVGAPAGSASDLYGGSVVHRSIDIPVGLLKSGSINTITISMLGRAKLDRLQFEATTSTKNWPTPTTTTTTSTTSTTTSTTTSSSTTSTTVPGGSTTTVASGPTTTGGPTTTSEPTSTLGPSTTTGPNTTQSPTSTQGPTTSLVTTTEAPTIPSTASTTTVPTTVPSVTTDPSPSSSPVGTTTTLP